MPSYEPREIKYVIATGGHPVLISPAMAHTDAANLRGYESAGLCTVANGSSGFVVRCHGQSRSLGIGSRPGDAELIQRMLSAEAPPKYVVLNEEYMTMMADWRLSRSALAGERRVVSSGYFRLGPGLAGNQSPLSVYCWGEGRGLRRGSNGDSDAELLQRTLLEYRTA